MRNYNWSEPEVTTPFTYSNEFGEVVFEPITDYLPIGEIDSNKLPEIEEVLVSIDTAEQATLITGNRIALMSFTFPLRDDGKTCFGLKYSCRNRAAVCRVTVNHFQTPEGISAQEQIECLAPKTNGPLPTY